MSTPQPGSPEFWDAHRREQEAMEQRATEATRRGAQALSRLMQLAEERSSGQIERVALFIGACWNGRRHFDFFDLRSLDVEISDDMIAVLDALRWGRMDIERMVPDGPRRIVALLTRWGLYGEDQKGQPIV